MACNFNFTEKAESDLDEILSYITNELCAPTAASELGRKIFENIDTVCEFPETGKLGQNEYVKDSEVRRVLIDNYILYYKQSEDIITVLRIVYAKRNLEDILQQIKIDR